MADGTTKPIEDVETGDAVQATDAETGVTESKTVTATISGHGVKHLVEIVIDTDGEHGTDTAAVTATDGHPFWVPELGEWLDATDLQPGQWLQTSTGTWVQITAVDRWTAQSATVHNLTVSDIHTYYVLADDESLLAHNCGTSGRPNQASLQGRVDDLEKQMGAGAGYRTASGLHVVEGVDLFAVGARSNISEAQIAKLDDVDEALRIYPGLPRVRDNPHLLGRNHAEGKLLTEAVNLGAQPALLIASRDFCTEYCAPLIERLGGKIITPTVAIW